MRLLKAFLQSLALLTVIVITILFYFLPVILLGAVPGIFITVALVFLTCMTIANYMHEE